MFAYTCKFKRSTVHYRHLDRRKNLQKFLTKNDLTSAQDLPSISMRGPKRLHPAEDRVERGQVGLLQRLAEVEKVESKEGSRTVPWLWEVEGCKVCVCAPCELFVVQLVGWSVGRLVGCCWL